MLQNLFRLFDINDIKSKIQNADIYSLNDDFLLLDNLNTKELAGPSMNDMVKAKDYVVIMCVSGNFYFRLNWNDIHLSAFDVIVVRPGNYCQFLSFEGCRLAVIAFSDAFYERKIDARILQLFMRGVSSPSCLHPSEKLFSDFIELYKSMCKVISSNDLGFKEMAINGCLQVGTAFLCQLAVDSYGKLDVVENRDYSAQKKLFDNFIKLVAEYHIKERSVTFYAGKLCVTPKYLSHVVVKEGHRCAVDIIRDEVISKAKALLKSRKYTVQQVADLLSFPNPSFFGKYFRQAVGVSPYHFMVC